MRTLHSTVLLASVALLAGCGGSAAGGDSTAVAPYAAANVSANASPASANAGSSTSTCPTADDVKSALGFDVRELTKGGMRRYGPVSSCGYAASDDNALPGVTVQFMIEPASEAAGRFDDMRKWVTVARGTPTEPDPVAVGERGMAFYSASRTLAAALSKGQLYSVDLRYGAVELTDKQDGIVTLLRKLIGA
jgi:hypothetical protein